MCASDMHFQINMYHAKSTIVLLKGSSHEGNRGCYTLMHKFMQNTCQFIPAEVDLATKNCQRLMLCLLYFVQRVGTRQKIQLASRNITQYLGCMKYSWQKKKKKYN